MVVVFGKLGFYHIAMIVVFQSFFSHLSGSDLRTVFFLLMLSPPIICLLDSHARILWVSRGDCRDFFVGHLLSDLVSASFLPDISGAVGDAIITGEPQSVYLRLRDNLSWCCSVFRSDVPDVPLVLEFLNIPCLPSELSRREVDVIVRLMHGMRAGEIQKDLNIGASTFADYQRSAMDKTGTNSPGELAICGVKMRLQTYESRSSLARI